MVFSAIILGFFIGRISNQNLTDEEDRFLSKINDVFLDKNLSKKDQMAKALELCRMTKGKVAAAAYFALDASRGLNNWYKDLEN